MTHEQFVAEIAVMDHELAAEALAYCFDALTLVCDERDYLRRQLKAYEVEDEAWLEMPELGGMQ